MVVAFICFAFVGALICSGSVTLSDFWTGTAVGLALIAIGILYWGFKPDIGRLIRGKRAIDNLLESLYFFITHWNTYKNLMQEKRLRKPQNGEIKWASDQIKDAITKIRLLNPRGINKEVLDSIQAVSDDMAMLGIDVLQRFPDHIVAHYTLDMDVTENLIFHGDAIYDELKLIIPLVKQMGKTD